MNKQVDSGLKIGSHGLVAHRRVRRVLQVLAIGIFLLVGAGFVLNSMQFMDGRWRPGFWPLVAGAMFFLAWLTARQKV